MKISKTSWLILISGIFIVAFASLGIAHAQQIQEQGQLGNDLATVEKRLSQLELRELSSKKLDKEEQLNQALTQLETVRDNINYPIESIQEADFLFQIADACNVAITDMTSSKVGKEKLANLGCSVLTLTVTAEGNVADLINFVIKLNSDFITGIVRSANIEIPEETDDEVRSPSIHIQMIIYSYQEG